MRNHFMTAAFAVVLALALAACGDKAAYDTTTTGDTGGTEAPDVPATAAAAPAISGGSWIGDAPNTERGLMAISFFKPG